MAVSDATGLSANWLEALSDGIFAIVLTLIALELKNPAVRVGAGQREVTKALLLLWPQMLYYVMSFGPPAMPTSSEKCSALRCGFSA